MRHPDHKRGLVERISDAIAFWLGRTRNPIVVPVPAKQIDLHIEWQEPRRIFVSGGAHQLNIPKLSSDGFGQIVCKHYGRFSDDGVEIWEASPLGEVLP